MKPRGVKIFWAVGVALVVAVAVGGLLWPWLLPGARVSDPYRRYEDNPHLGVTFLRNFPVNDTLAVDVTLLQARDDEGWDTLRADFRIPELPDHIQKRIAEGKDLTGVRLVPKSDPTLPMDTVDITRNNVLGVSPLKRTISIFTTDTKEQQLAVMHYNYWK
jgi:hypothetical protein